MADRYAEDWYEHGEQLTVSVVAEERRQLDRRQEHRWTYPERRSGFDRRAAKGGKVARAYRSALLTYRDRPRTLLLVLALFTVLNFADLVLTQRALLAGGEEVNPVMRFFRSPEATSYR